MIDEVLHLTKHLENLKIDEDQVLRLVQNFKHLNIDQRQALEADLFRKYPSDFHPQLRKILDLAVHISECRTPRCQYPNCSKVKGYYRHSVRCKIRVAGGCHLCNEMWNILKVHTLACNESNCNVPRCRYFKLSDPRLGAAKVAENLNIKGTPKELHDLVVHIGDCRTPHCEYPNCGKLKGLISHNNVCKTCIAGGCHLCKEARHIFRNYFLACQESNCNLPFCGVMEERRVRWSDSKREAAKLADSLDSKGTPENLKSILDLVMHISQCREDSCLYPNCDYAKGLFLKYRLCKTRVAGGCRECYRMWRLLQLHAQACKESNCNVPRCRDLKEQPLLHFDPKLGAAALDACSSC